MMGSEQAALGPNKWWFLALITFPALILVVLTFAPRQMQTLSLRSRGLGDRSNQGNGSCAEAGGAIAEELVSASMQAVQQELLALKTQVQKLAETQGLNAKLQILQREMAALKTQLQAASRATVFDTAWGRDGLDKLSTWRSTLFLRTAQQYTELEKQESGGGTGHIGRVEPQSWARYDVASPVATCPFGQLQRVGGSGDGGKFLCMEGLLDMPGCVIYSLGSNGQYEFEEAMLKSSTCSVHTLDCTYNGQSLDGNNRHFYHKICLGRETTTVVANDGSQVQYMDYSSVLKQLGHVNKTIVLLKIDIEGYEFDVLSGWKEQEGCNLPIQIAMEVHYQGMYNLMTNAPVAITDFSHLFWPQHQLSLAEISVWFGHFANLGYVVVSREDNPMGANCCSEFTLIKVEQPASCPIINWGQSQAPASR